MKKILFLMLCFCCINVVQGETLEYIELPYYVKLTKNGIDNIINVKKIYDKDTNEVVFSLDINDYELKNNYIKSAEINKDNYGRYYNNVNFFNTIVYYGYNCNKTDLNYFYTQVMVWNLINSYSVSIVDKYGNELEKEMTEFRTLWTSSMQHDVNPNFHNKEYTINLWEELNLKYYSNNIILDNPIIDGLIFNNDGIKLNVYGNKVGKYKVELTKDFNSINYSYYDGVNYYWQNLGGPSDINKSFMLNIIGIDLKIKENIIGINNKIGDAKIVNSQYELYLDDELVLNIEDLENNYVKSNSDYILKDTSINNGLINSDDILINVLEDDIEIIINKQVISKNLSIDINDDNVYEIYLKSSNKLYEIIDRNTGVIALPFGTYYIKSNDNDYYYEFLIKDSADELLVIDNSINEEINGEIDNEIVKDDEVIDNNREEIENKNEVIKEDNINNKEVSNTFIKEVENPKTIDNIFMYINLFMISIVSLFILIRKVNND